MPLTNTNRAKQPQHPTASIYSRPNSFRPITASRRSAIRTACGCRGKRWADLQSRLAWSSVLSQKWAAGVVMGGPHEQLLPGNSTAAAQRPTKLAADGATIRIPPVQPENQISPRASPYNAVPPLTAASINPDAQPRRMTTTTIAIPSEMACNPLLTGGAASPGISQWAVQPPETLNSLHACQRQAVTHQS